MRRSGLALLVMLAACAPATTSGTSLPSSASPTSASASPSATQAPVPVPTNTQSPAPTQAPPPDPRGFADVRVQPGVFAITTNLHTRLAVVDESVIGAARWGVERYLSAIDSYRNGQSPVLPITGPFLDAVSAALKDSATPGVTRAFQIESLSVDAHVQKPWGTHAYVDVTVGLVDRAVVGNAPDQRETGRLRLTGDKMFVTDGWDYQNGRWFNGFAPLPLDQVRRDVADAVNNYLSWESWALGASPNSWAIESTFQRKRADRVSAIDPRQVTSRFFEGTTASIERFETIEGIWSGIATVRLDGTIVTTNAAGATTREKFTRMVRAFVLGNWLGEVVDEQGTNGEWASEGDLALQQIDVNRA